MKISTLMKIIKNVNTKKNKTTKKHIFIFENSKAPHETSLISAMKMFKHLGFNVTFCLNAKAALRITDLSPVHIDVIIVDGGFWLAPFFKVFRKNDFVFFNTISMRSLFVTCIVSIMSKNRIFFLRNINSWLYWPEKNGISLKNIVMGATLHSVKVILMKWPCYFAVGSFNMKNYLSLSAGRSSFVVPFNMGENKMATDSFGGIYNFVIPGVIDLSRKDLTRIKEASLLFDQRYTSKFKIILLGYPSTKLDWDFVLEWKRELGDALSYYDSFIDDVEFDKVLRNADIVMGVLKENYQDKYGNREVYGRSKDTGVEAHALAYTKPLFVNSEYEVDEHMRSSTITFTTAQGCFSTMKGLIDEDIKFCISDLFFERDSYGLENLSKGMMEVIKSDLYHE